ncbi:RNA polymerase sigma factor SigF [Streptacidiphilus jiangxiensis]|uniref:RNA polymerase sigma-B factor n=1 Tax=Streptacidiphilus jiangxiensis TaxID=235985 RepID=A0A1H7G4W0_STRJI|nr:RNA polymerase sigma factor SigF [Streptacidiphilus jiangxiensis]SEK31832.1 RNA polymerase sigma-B factor [Streptacidiphilus jiangxiensis]
MRDLNHRPGTDRAHVPAQADASDQKQTEARVFADDPERADARTAPEAASAGPADDGPADFGLDTDEIHDADGTDTEVGADEEVDGIEVVDAEAGDADADDTDGEPRKPAEPWGPGSARTAAPQRHSAPDREAARALFVRLAQLPEGSPERVELRNQLVRMHIPLVEHLARRFRNRGEPLDDLTQVATIGLIKSVDRFDPERGVEFSTYATPTIVGEIKRHFRDKGWAVRVPRRLQELRLSLTTATSELSQRHGRSPTVHELAEHLGISEEEVLEGLESANAYSTLSLDVPDTDDESPAVADTLGAEDDALEGVEYRESLKPLLAQLPQREQRILVLRFFRNMTQSQIAAEVGISQMHVSRLLARTLAQLREKLLIEE